MEVGFELPNVTSGEISPEEWRRWDVLPGKVAKLRGYSLTKGNLDYLSATKPIIILRPNSDGEIDVAERIAELRNGIVQLLQWGFPSIWVLVDSEPNLGSKPCPSDYWRKVDQVVAGCRIEGVSNVFFASPPLAVMQNEEEWYDAGRESIEAKDAVAVHLYGQLNADLVHRSLALAHQFNIPIIAPEIGDSHETANDELKAVSVSSYIRIAAESGVSVGALFIMGGLGWPGFVLPPDVIERWISPVVEMVSHETPA